MTELLKNAWLGWQEFIADGKLVVLFAAGLIFMWAVYAKLAKKALLLYTTVMAVCCIFPLTAAALMLYQTKFYDYQWIWSLVPVTATIAAGAVGFLAEAWQDFRKAERKKGMPALALLLGILILCGGLGKLPSAAKDASSERAQAASVLATVTQQLPKETVCLWAPREIMEYVRETDPSVTLIYGRNMWDEWLNAYSYDVYSEELCDLYGWMEELAETGHAESVEKRVEAGFAAGANCILLPDTMEENGLERACASMQLRVINIEGYYLLMN